MPRQTSIPTKQILYPPDPTIPEDMSVRLQPIPLQILLINRAEKDVHDLRPPFYHRVPRISEVCPAPRTELPRHFWGGVVCREQRIRGRLSGQENLRGGDERPLLVALDGRGIAREEGEADLCEGVADRGEGEAGGDSAAVVAVADNDEWEGDRRIGPWVGWARGFGGDVDGIADRTAAAATVDCEGFQRQWHCTE